jgi:hypothetical protein
LLSSANCVVLVLLDASQREATLLNAARFWKTVNRGDSRANCCLAEMTQIFDIYLLRYSASRPDGVSTKWMIDKWKGTAIVTVGIILSGIATLGPSNVRSQLQAYLPHLYQLY